MGEVIGAGLEKALRGRDREALRSAISFLPRAHSVLRRRGWTEGATARTVDGRAVDPLSKEADTFSISGAIRLTAPLGDETYTAMIQAATLAAQRRVNSPLTLDLWNNGFCEGPYDAGNLLHEAALIIAGILDERAVDPEGSTSADGQLHDPENPDGSAVEGSAGGDGSPGESE